jgi:glutamate dehydrogenase
MAGDAYERQAVRQLIEDLLDEQALLTRAVMAAAKRDTGKASVEAARGAVDAWIARSPGPAEAPRRLIAEIEDAGEGWSFAKLTIVNAAMRALAQAAS